jgi:hypothetical protein
MWKESVVELQEVISRYFLVWAEKDDREPITGKRFESGTPQYES